jgi:hypothetical protein
MSNAQFYGFTILISLLAAPYVAVLSFLVQWPAFGN